MAVLILGDGILATELVKQTGWRFISRKKNKLEFTQPESYSGLIEGYDVIVNCIACTDTYSTDKQKTWYGYTKMLGDAHVQLAADSFLICRESHKPYPFSYKQAWSNQYTNGDYVPVIADLIVQLINKGAKGVYNVGTEIKTWFKHTKEEFSTEPVSKPDQAPADVTMNLNKLKDALKRTNK